jgi:6-phosphogluconolactonase (cycloisomerase 2 family)
LGTLGDVIFPYSSSSGITSSYVAVISPGSSISGDYSVALDANNYAYIASTSALTVYSIASNGAATQLSTKSYDGGAVPRSVVLSSGYGEVYTANEGASTISGYSISNGLLTAISGSPFSGPADVSAIGVDNTGKYLVAAGFDGSSGVELYSIGSSGVVSPVVGAGTGTATTYPALLALTH